MYRHGASILYYFVFGVVSLLLVSDPDNICIPCLYIVITLMKIPVENCGKSGGKSLGHKKEPATTEVVTGSSY